MDKVINILLLAPTLFVLGFFAYVFLANDPGCGSQNPGACFGAGVLMMFIAPVALVTLPALIIKLTMNFFQRRKNKAEQNS